MCLVGSHRGKGFCLPEHIKERRVSSCELRAASGVGVWFGCGSIVLEARSSQPEAIMLGVVWGDVFSEWENFLIARGS